MSASFFDRSRLFPQHYGNLEKKIQHTKGRGTAPKIGPRQHTEKASLPAPYGTASQRSNRLASPIFTPYRTTPLSIRIVNPQSGLMHAQTLYSSVAPRGPKSDKGTSSPLLHF